MSYAPLSKLSKHGWEGPIVSTSQGQNNKRNSSQVPAVDVAALLGRPSAVSKEYDKGVRSEGVSIANMLEWQTWEKRRGISNDFDPQRRGYTMSRDNQRILDNKTSVGNRSASRSPSMRHAVRNSHHPRDRTSPPRSHARNHNSSASRRRYEEMPHRSSHGDNYHHNRNKERDQYDHRGYERDRERHKRHHNHDSYKDRHYQDRKQDEVRSTSRRTNGGGSYTRWDDDRRGRDYDHHSSLERHGRRDGDEPPRRDLKRSIEELSSQDQKDGYLNRNRSDEESGSNKRHYSETSCKEQEQPYSFTEKQPRHETWRDPDHERKDRSIIEEPVKREHATFGRGYDDLRPRSHTTTNNNDDGNGEQWEIVPSRSRKSHRSASAGTNTGDESSSLDEKDWAPRVSYIPRTELNSNFQRFMLILVGIPGSGKSLFATSVEKAMPWKYQRINQDVLGRRVLCEDAARQALAEGKCPIIDRCNFSVAQRKFFLDIANDFKVPVECVVLNVPLDECIRRCESRQNHETVKPAEAREVVQRMALQFCPPLPNRVNLEQFTSIKTIADLTSFNDAVLEYLNKM